MTQVLHNCCAKKECNKDFSFFFHLLLVSCHFAMDMQIKKRPRFCESASCLTSFAILHAKNIWVSGVVRVLLALSVRLHVPQKAFLKPLK